MPFILFDFPKISVYKLPHIRIFRRWMATWTGKSRKAKAEDVGKKWTTRWWIFNLFTKYAQRHIGGTIEPQGNRVRWKFSKHVRNHQPSFSQPACKTTTFLGCYYIPLKINLVTTSNLIFFHLDPSVESSFNWESYDCKAKNGPVGSTWPKILRRKFHKKTSE